MKYLDIIEDEALDLLQDAYSQIPVPSVRIKFYGDGEYKITGRQNSQKRKQNLMYLQMLCGLSSVGTIDNYISNLSGYTPCDFIKEMINEDDLENISELLGPNYKKFDISSLKEKVEEIYSNYSDHDNAESDIVSTLLNYDYLKNSEDITNVSFTFSSGSTATLSFTENCLDKKINAFDFNNDNNITLDELVFFSNLKEVFPGNIYEYYINLVKEKIDGSDDNFTDVINHVLGIERMDDSYLSFYKLASGSDFEKGEISVYLSYYFFKDMDSTSYVIVDSYQSGNTTTITYTSETFYYSQTGSTIPSGPTVSETHTFTSSAETTSANTITPSNSIINPDNPGTHPSSATTSGGTENSATTSGDTEYSGGSGSGDGDGTGTSGSGDGDNTGGSGSDSGDGTGTSGGGDGSSPSSPYNLGEIVVTTTRSNSSGGVSRLSDVTVRVDTSYEDMFGAFVLGGYNCPGSVTAVKDVTNPFSGETGTKYACCVNTELFYNFANDDDFEDEELLGLVEKFFNFLDESIYDDDTEHFEWPNSMSDEIKREVDAQIMIYGFECTFGQTTQTYYGILHSYDIESSYMAGKASELSLFLLNLCQAGIVNRCAVYEGSSNGQIPIYELRSICNEQFDNGYFIEGNGYNICNQEKDTLTSYGFNMSTYVNIPTKLKGRK